MVQTLNVVTDPSQSNLQHLDKILNVVLTDPHQPNPPHKDQRQLYQPTIQPCLPVAKVRNQDTVVV